MMRNLVLHVKDIYFQQAKAGIKTEEYRLYNDYWRSKLVNQRYDNIVYMSGYPKRGDEEKILVFPYRSYSVRDITHEHFGYFPETVFVLPLLT